MTRIYPIVALALVSLSSVSPLLAHELKVFANVPAESKVGDRATVYLSWGHALPVDDLTDGESLERYDWISPAGKVSALKREGVSLQTNVVQLKDQGVAQVVVAKKPFVFSFVYDDDEGTSVFKRGPKTAFKAETVDYSVREQQFAKTLVVVGTPKAEPIKPAGLPIEIVPVDGPTAWRSGGMVRFQVVCGKKILSHQEVKATRVGFRPQGAWCFSDETDEKGIVSVPVKEAGTWVLRVERRELAKGKDRDGYDYNALTGTLVLEVQP